MHRFLPLVEMTGTNKIKFAIIGCGSIAQRHALHISKAGELTAVCDIIPSKAKALAKKYGAKPYNSLQDLLKNHTGEIDVLAVCTPNGLHAAHSIMALKAGMHVLCEKPMALTVKDCNGMIAAAKKAKKYLLIVKQNRFNPPVTAVKELLGKGRLGKISSIQLNCFWNRDAGYYKNPWKGTKELDGGILFTQFSHFIDLLYWMFGDVKKVKGFSANYLHQKSIAFEDTVVASVQFKNGIIGTLHFTINSFQKNTEGSLTIFGEKGTVKIGGEYLNELEYQRIKGYTIKDLPKGNPANSYGQYTGSMSNHDKVYQNLMAVLHGKENIATSGYEGMKTVEMVKKIYGGVGES